MGELTSAENLADSVEVTKLALSSAHEVLCTDTAGMRRLHDRHGV